MAVIQENMSNSEKSINIMEVNSIEYNMRTLELLRKDNDMFARGLYSPRDPFGFISNKEYIE